MRGSGLGNDIRGAAGWAEWVASGERPDDIPSEPQRTYSGKGWVSWEDWLRPAAQRTAWTNKPRGADVMAELEGELAAAGLGKPAPLRGCRCLVLDLCDGATEPADDLRAAPTEAGPSGAPLEGEGVFGYPSGQSPRSDEMPEVLELTAMAKKAAVLTQDMRRALLRAKV